MKLVFRQYLSSLRERGELDAVLPDLLSELGYNVISRPSVGTRQFGVDVAALSPPSTDGKRRLYLFSIKQGDLTRADWDGTPQALRSSINEILDVYIPSRIAPAHRSLDIVICLCFGGDVQEAVRDNLTHFTSERSRDGLTFEEWNGDYLAGLLVEGVLREQLVNPELRSHFQKAVAMVDEPDVAFEQFATLITKLCAVANTTARERTTILRQLYICLWVLFAWSRDAGNLEGAYRATERAVLHAWPLIRDDVTKSTSASREIGAAYSDLVDLHFRVWDALIGQKILPYVDAQHAISVAVDSSSPADVNLKLFEVLGRIAMRGLWYLWLESGRETLPTRRANWGSEPANLIAKQIVHLIRNNPILLTPITDRQGVDIAVALLFLTMMEEWEPAARNYAEGLIQRITYAFTLHDRYPTIHDDYRSLVAHPRQRTDAYREGETKGSTILPLIAIWAASTGATEAAEYLSEFARDKLKHCNFQFWLPGTDSEARLYTGDTQHGAALCDIPITGDGAGAMTILLDECGPESPFMSLSSVSLGHWPLLALACRHYRLPLPPNLWVHVIEQARAQHLEVPSAKEKSQSKRTRSGRRQRRKFA